MRKSLRSRAAGGNRLRAHTRALLVDAALALFSRQSLRVPAIYEIAAQAGVATGTFYNYFRTREELLEAAIVERSERLQHAITASYARVVDPAERVAIGSRRFVLQAAREPLWAAGLLRMLFATPEMLARMLAPVLADLRAGRRSGRFRLRDDGVATDLVVGTVAAAMRRVLDGAPGDRHASAVAAVILRGLGIDAAEADALARRELPSFAGDDERPATAGSPVRPR